MKRMRWIESGGKGCWVMGFMEVIFRLRRDEVGGQR